MLGKIAKALADQVRIALPKAAIWPGPPRAMGDQDPLEVAIWLYHITPDAVSNFPPVRTADRSFVAPRLSVSLHYLLVVGGGSVREAHDGLGLLWKTVHQHAVLSDAEIGSNAVQLHLETLDLPTLAGLWATLAPLPMRPSIAITARGVEP